MEPNFIFSELDGYTTRMPIILPRNKGMGNAAMAGKKLTLVDGTKLYILCA
jgi:hypothetical protein